MTSTLGPAALTERVYVSQFGSPVFGLTTIVSGEPGDADAPPQVEVIAESDGSVLDTLTATHIDTGIYEVTLTSVLTQHPGFFTLNWTYTIDTVNQVFKSYYEVGQANPAYDNLPEALKDLVDDVWMRFADTYDSPDGGPHLQVELQTHFNRGRIAQLARSALSRLNMVSQPKMVYVLTDEEEGKTFPLNKWGGLLEQATYVETIKHLRRTYVEQPEVVGVNVARLDRRDYLQRWGDILRDEQEDLQDAMEVFKIAHMGLGRPAVMVSGGVFGNYGPTRVGHANAARPRHWYRYH